MREINRQMMIMIWIYVTDANIQLKMRIINKHIILFIMPIILVKFSAISVNLTKELLSLGLLWLWLIFMLKCQNRAGWAYD